MITLQMFIKYRQYLIYIILCVVGVANVFWPVFSLNFKVIQPDAGDTVFNAVILEHVYKSFFDFNYKASFYSPMFFYPDKLVLTYSDNLLGSAPIYWLLRIFFDPLISAQVWGIVVIVLTYFAYIYFLRRLKVLPSLSALVSFVFCFGILKVNGIAHPQMFPQFYTPLFFVALLGFLKNPTFKLFNLAVLFIFLQTLAGYYLGWYLIFSLLIFIPLYTYFAKDDLLRIVVFVKLNKKSLVKSLLLWAILFGAFWGPYFYTSSRFKYSCCKQMVSTLLMTPERYFTPPAGGFYSKILHLAMPEQSKYYIWGYGGYLFEGLFGVLVLYAGYKLFKQKDKAPFLSKIALSMFTTGFILNVLSIKVFKFSLWFLVYNFIPGADGIRFVHRIWYISYFYMFAAAAIFFSNLFAERSLLPAKNKMVYGLVLLFLVIEQISFFNLYVYKEPFSQLTSKIENKIRENSCTLFYFATTEDEQQTITYSLLAMYASIATNVPTVNGYSGLVSIDLRKPLSIVDVQNKVKDAYKGYVCYLNEDPNTKELSVTTYLLPLKQ